MADPDYIALINAELDGELDAAQRAELARGLLADPAVRALREDFRRLGQLLEQMEAVEPPAELHEGILAAMRQHIVKRPSAFSPAWRLAAVLAGLVVAGALLLETTVKGPNPGSGDLSGTIAAQTSAMIDTVELGGAVSGRVSLYRDRAQLTLRFETVASAPVDVVIASDGHTLRINALGGPDKSGAGAGSTVPLPGFLMNGQPLDLTFLMGGHPVAKATLRAPAAQ